MLQPRLEVSILDYIETITIPTPFSVGPINCYLVRGSELTLIDTGPNDPATATALRAALSERGVTFRDIQRVIITHAHVDHFGLAAQIVAASGAQVLSHERNRWWLTDYENETVRRSEYNFKVFEESGAPRELAEMVAQGVRGMMRYAAAIPPDRFVSLKDGDAIMLGDDEWRVVFAPGHASGLICLHNSKARALISSDHLLRDITSNPVLEPPARGETERPRALVDYMASMQQTAELDLRLALPAHGEPIYDVRALVAARLAFHRARLAHIEQQLECCVGTAFELCNVLFPNLKSIDVFLGLSEVIGHLDVLEMEGRVRCEKDQRRVVQYIPSTGKRGMG